MLVKMLTPMLGVQMLHNITLLLVFPRLLVVVVQAPLEPN